jgi:hypothetical protein
LKTEEAQSAFKQDVLREPEIAEALGLAREAAFTEAELEAYDKYWDMVSTERTLMRGKLEEGIAKAYEERKSPYYRQMLSRWLAAGKAEAEFWQIFGEPSR